MNAKELKALGLTQVRYDALLAAGKPLEAPDEYIKRHIGEWDSPDGYSTRWPNQVNSYSLNGPAIRALIDGGWIEKRHCRPSEMEKAMNTRITGLSEQAADILMQSATLWPEALKKLEACENVKDLRDEQGYFLTSKARELVKATANTPSEQKSQQ